MENEPTQGNAPQPAAPQAAAPKEEPKKEEPKAQGAASSGAHAPRTEDEMRLLAALSYVGVLFVVPLFVARDSEFCKFHVRQGIALFAIEVVLSFGFLHPVLGGPIGLLIGALSIYCIVRTLQGAKWELPVIGKYAQKIKL